MTAAKQINPLRIAVLLTYEAQMLDLSGIDLFGMMSKEYLGTSLPKPLSQNGLDIKIWYVGKPETKRDTFKVAEGTNAAAVESGLQSLTAQAKIKTTATVLDAEVQPGQIDIVLIPGPDPAHVHEWETLDFVKNHAEHGTTILVVCTGAYVAAESGILDGIHASGPRALVPSLRKKYPAVQWDEQRRFVKSIPKKGSPVKGEVWSSGGITNGLEMVAAYLKEKYPGPVSQAVCAMADVGEKGEFYDTKVSVDTAWWLGQILRALFLGKRR